MKLFNHFRIVVDFERNHLAKASQLVFWICYTLQISFGAKVWPQLLNSPQTNNCNYKQVLLSKSQ